MRAWALSVGVAVTLLAGYARSQTPLPQAGPALFAAKCAVCHGDAMTGGDHAPALKGEVFWSDWKGQPARRLYSRILSTMPMDDPGSLTGPEAMMLVRHIAAANGAPIPDAAEKPADLDAVIFAAGRP